ncbi:acetate kinase [Firmicutes bacterium CAG:884]|nr:acetate kinase [Bacillota bacterium]CCY93759.1 acetate kinase [Firmicutes bacterium CAG:884]
MKILCVNAGSSSLKFQLYEMPEEKVLISGYIEKIGMPDCFWNVKINGEKIRSEKYLKNHTEAVEVLIEELFKNKVVESLDEIKGVGHRVLHGGEKYADSVVITDEVVKDIEDLTKLGPLHHPGNLAGINAMRKALPGVVNVAVFDTAFHQTMPKENFIYPVPYEWYTKYGVRKYGFHGTSHKYITGEMKKRLGKENVNLIICHVGSGASIACVKDGKCYDTTMGLTPLDGLMMGTRSGAIDPSILKYVMQESGETIDEITDDLNKKSGFYGVCGAADCRDVEHLAEEGNENAILALNMYANRIAKYIMDYYLELEGKVDTIVFTAGVLENGSTMRKMVMDRLKVLGITLDEELNNKIAGFKELHEGIISDGDSKIAVMVLPTNEEIMIVKDTFNKVIG